MTHTPRYDDDGPNPSEHTAVPTIAAYPPAEFAPTGQPLTADPSGAGETSTGSADVAKDEAAAVKDTAVDAGKNLASTAKDEAAQVVAETKTQARSLLGSVTSEVRDQAGSQQQKIAASVQSLSQELTGMASGSSESGPLTDLVEQAGRKGGEIAQWLQDREPRDVLDEIRSFARRKPGTFLVACGLAGVVAGRLTRGAVAANAGVDSRSTPRPAVVADRSAPTPELPATPLYDEVLSANPDLAARDLAAPDLGSQGERIGGMR